MTRLLILRPQPGADATAAKARQLGLDPIVAPLFTIQPVEWEAPDPQGIDAVLLTSANAARQGGDKLETYRTLPTFTAGDATADAACAAGFQTVLSAKGDGDAALQMALTAGYRRLLHLSGRDFHPLADNRAQIIQRAVYASEAVSDLPLPARHAIAQGAIALLHSARAANVFVALIEAARLERSGVSIAALSPVIAQAAARGWARLEVAPEPNDDSLLAVAARMCEQGRNGEGKRA